MPLVWRTDLDYRIYECVVVVEVVDVVVQVRLEFLVQFVKLEPVHLEQFLVHVEPFVVDLRRRE